MENIRPLFLQLPKDEQKSAIEALIFASEEPLTQKSLYNILITGNYHGNSKSKKQDSPDVPLIEAEDPGTYEDEARNKYNFSIGLFDELIAEINHELIHSNRPFQIIRVGNGYQFCTRREYGELIHHLSKTRAKRRFSQAALETLAIIAYRQPITRPEIDQIRGVSSGEVVNSLLDKTIIEIQGRKEAIGKPLLYGTSMDFLKMFGINAIDELPKLRDLEDIAEQLNSESSGDDILIDVSELPPDLPPDVKVVMIEDFDEAEHTAEPEITEEDN